MTVFCHFHKQKYNLCFLEMTKTVKYVSFQSIRNEGHKYGVQIKNMGPKRATLPNADFWQAPTASPPQYNNENQKPPKATKVKVDANANEILPPRYPVRLLYFSRLIILFILDTSVSKISDLLSDKGRV